MKLSLKLLFGSTFVFHLVRTALTFLRVKLWNAWPWFAANRWAMAAFYDAYFGFLAFFCWLWRERSLRAKIVRCELVMAGDNINIFLCVLLRPYAVRPGEPAFALFPQRAAA